MRILHSVGSFVNGGIETLLVNVANLQVLQGCEVAILIVTSKWSQEMVDSLDKRIRLFVVNKPVGSKNPLYLLKLLCYYKKFKPDVLHLHAPGAEKLFLFKPKHERRIVTIHNDIIPIPFSRTVNQYVAISDCVLDSFRRKTGRENCVVCYNGVNPSRFCTRKTYATVPRKLLFVGRVLFDVKGQDIVLNAITKLPERIKSNIHLDIWGDGADMNRMKQMVVDLKLDSIVTVAGNKSNDEVAKHICDYDVMIQASRHEGLGISAIEAMLSGVPLFVSSAKGFLEVTENGKYGTVFTHSDVNAFVENFVQFYDNYVMAVDKAKLAIAHAVQKFSMETYISSLMKIYNG